MTETEKTKVRSADPALVAALYDAFDAPSGGRINADARGRARRRVVAEVHASVRDGAIDDRGEMLAEVDRRLAASGLR